MTPSEVICLRLKEGKRYKVDYFPFLDVILMMYVFVTYSILSCLTNIAFMAVPYAIQYY